MKGIFISKNSQVRSGWKIASVIGSFYVGTILLSMIVMAIYVVIRVAMQGVGPNGIIGLTKDINAAVANINGGLGITLQLVQCLCVIFSVVLFWKVYDKKPIREIGLINIKSGSADLIKGLIFGAVSLLIVFAILLSSGQVLLINQLSKPNFNYTLLTGLIIFIFVGINEEMLARGYCMTVLKQTGSRYVPAIVSAVIFALMHSMNSGISALSYVNLFLFGLLTAFMVIKSGNLWLSIGYHITWNYFEGNICGFLVSGQEATGMYNVKVPFNNIINGGKFGPEGGLVVTFIILAGFFYLWKFYKPSRSHEYEA